MNVSRSNLALLIAATVSFASCSKASLPKDTAGESTASPRPAPPVSSGSTVDATPGMAMPGNRDTRSESNPGRTPSEKADWAAIQQLEAQAKKLAHLEGCNSADDCRSAPVGSRGCGGPRYYLAWCAKTTDSAALYRKLDEVAAAERAYNKKYQIGSTCEMRMPSVVGASGGSCIAQ